MYARIYVQEMYVCMYVCMDRDLELLENSMYVCMYVCMHAWTEIWSFWRTAYMYVSLYVLTVEHFVQYIEDTEYS